MVKKGWVVLMLAGMAWAADGGKVLWEKDFDKAQEKASREGKPLLLYFTTDG